MKKYTFSNGDVVTSNLEAKELIKRMNRLDTLRVLTEGFEEGEGRRIADKAWRAWNKSEDFTGIIRLSITEKDFLSYILGENDFITDEEREVLRFYIN